MNHEKIIIRENGTRVKIRVSLWVDFQEVHWNVSVSYCLKRKRNWINTYNTDDYDYRKLNKKEQEQYILESNLKHVTKHEILKAKMELLEIIKPVLENEKS